MARTISLKTVKASTYNPNEKPKTGDKTLELEKAIPFYDIEKGDKTEEGEESEILVVHN